MHVKNSFIQDITQFIFLEDQPSEADIIFIPGCAFPDLMERAAKLWHENFAPLLLPSGKYSIVTGSFSLAPGVSDLYKGTYGTECDFYVDIAARCGVPLSSMLMENEATYTMQNACFSRTITDKHGLMIKKAILCCKSVHARRATMYYQYAFPEAKILTIPVDINEISFSNWFESADGIEAVMGELTRCGSQFAGLIPSFKKFL